MALMLTLKISDISTVGRIREDYGDLTELKDSIKRNGLFLPIAVTEIKKGKYQLLDGDRRLQAHKELGLSTIDCNVLKPGEEISDLDKKIIELEANVHRKDFTWQEDAKIKKQIHDLMTEKYGRKGTNPKKGSPSEVGWSQKDTAKMLGVSDSTLSNEIKLATYGEANPEVFRFKTKDDATKGLKRILRKGLNEQDSLAAVEAMKKKLDQEKLQLIDCYIVGDFFKGAETLIADKKQFDIIECDPPYGVDILQNKKGEKVKENTGEYIEIPADKYLVWMDEVLRILFKLMKKDSWLILWGSMRWLIELIPVIQSLNLKVDPIPCIWYKRAGQTQQTTMYLGRTYETFLMIRKGSPVLHKQGRPNVFMFTGAPRKVHATERPIEMIEEVLKTLMVGKKEVLVPFLGSGNTILAAANLGMSAIGFDVSQAYKDTFILKINEHISGSKFQSYTTPISTLRKADKK